MSLTNPMSVTQTGTLTPCPRCGLLGQRFERSFGVISETWWAHERSTVSVGGCLVEERIEVLEKQQ